VDAFDFEPEHGQALGELLRRPIKIDVLFQPIKGDFHFSKSNKTNSFFLGLFQQFGLRTLKFRVRENARAI
jgi:hypothetical protein